MRSHDLFRAVGSVRDCDSNLADTRAALRLVTNDNAHEFAPVPRKRGRPRKIDARDNVIPIGSRRSAAVPVAPTYALSIDEHART